MHNLPLLPSSVGSPPYGAHGVPIVLPASPPVQAPTVRAMATRPLLSLATRKATIQLASSLRNYEVTSALEAAGLLASMYKPIPDGLSRSAKVMYVLGEMSTSLNAGSNLDRSFDHLDWSRPDQVLRALDVIAELLWLYELRLEEGEDDFYGTREKALRLRRLLKKEGYHVDEDANIQPPPEVFAVGSLAALRDASAIRAILKRINKALPDDPALAIGSAKELIEATAKTVLVARGKDVTPKDDLPALVHRAELALCVHPQSVTNDVDGAPEVRKVLGLLTSFADRLAELRNKYGTGHGVAALPEGLRPRHGRLAVATADAWCSFMLDTLVDTEASWRGRRA